MSGKVLIVEDEIALSDVYKTLLDQAGYDVRVAENGEVALTVADEFQPEMILLDLRMPVLDGIGFLEKYDLKNKHPDVKVVVFSNYDMQKEIDEAYSLGAERYLLKAWASPKELIELVKTTLGK